MKISIDTALHTILWKKLQDFSLSIKSKWKELFNLKNILETQQNLIKQISKFQVTIKTKIITISLKGGLSIRVSKLLILQLVPPITVFMKLQIQQCKMRISMTV